LKIQCYLVGSQTYWHKGRRGPYQIAEVPQMCWINALPGLIPPGEKPAWIKEKKKKKKRGRTNSHEKLRGGRKKKKTKKRKRKKKKQRGKKNKKKKRKRERSLENKNKLKNKDDGKQLPNKSQEVYIKEGKRETKNQPKFLNIFRLSWNSDQEMD
ncbi:unnamed protein product, partial [Bubo scandiacus]